MSEPTIHPVSSRSDPAIRGWKAMHGGEIRFLPAWRMERDGAATSPRLAMCHPHSFWLRAKDFPELGDLMERKEIARA